VKYTLNSTDANILRVPTIGMINNSENAYCLNDAVHFFCDYVLTGDHLGIVKR
jgi:hypothetical protein